MTPRKPRQRQHNNQPASSRLIQASEYESDVQNYAAHVPPPMRTNTELNTSVLRRYNPSIRNILSIAANAVVYLFTPPEHWERSSVEGPLFVCDQEPDSRTGEESFCMVVFNRRGLDNLIVDLGATQDVEVTSEFLIMRFQEGGSEAAQKVLGIWIHKDKDDTREVNCGLIHQCWEKARASRLQMANAMSGMGIQGTSGTSTSGAPSQPGALGRRISLRDLFQQGGGTY